MTKPPPLTGWAARHRAAALALAIGALVVPSVALAATMPLHEDRAAGGIVDLELAGSVERTSEIVDSWRAEGVLDVAAFLQGLDFLYPLLYAAALAAGCVAASALWRETGRPGMAAPGAALAWVALAAAPFDYVENVALMTAILGEPASPWPQVALAFAVLKFACIAASLAYCLSGLVAAMLARRAPSTPAAAPGA